MASQQKDLLEFIDQGHIECLNESPKCTAANCLKSGYRDQDDLYLESDADEQLLLNVPFNQKVKLQAIVVKGPADAGPCTVKLYANRSGMGFSDVQGSVPSSQDLQLTPAQLASGEPIQLKMVKFAFTTHLTIFIESNQAGEETTKVSKIAFLGQSGEVFDVAQIKKVEEGK